jgi:glycosyltransferase involved in cell wall biosynthesis
MRYNAGSEVYAQNLTLALARRGHHVAVFSRCEDLILPEYALLEERDGEIPHYLVNLARSQARVQHEALDQVFADVLEREQPEVVHFHHLNHLSLGLVAMARRTGAVVVFTVHDFWLCCPRGQLVSWALEGEPWALCSGQDDARCARACFTRSYTGLADFHAQDEAYWTAAVAARMAAVEALLPHIDLFVCPSRTVAAALVARFPQVAGRLVLQDYGFPAMKLAPPTPREAFTFGYLGTHTAPKGLDLLIRAFRGVRGEARLILWGRPRGQATDGLYALAEGDPRIRFEDEYRNGALGGAVLPAVDCVVVPSIWLENSPLVIHEAQQARRCVVTADAGGMAELVAHEVNGLLFRHRDEEDLRRQLQRLVDEPGLAARLGARGYLGTSDGHVPSIDAEAGVFEEHYARLLAGVRA